jgi:hypothetical protein
LTLRLLGRRAWMRSYRIPVERVDPGDPMCPLLRLKAREVEG